MAPPLRNFLCPPPPARPPRGSLTARAAAGGGGSNGSKRPAEFGYTRKDVILIGAGLIGLGYILYYGLQAAGMDAGMAGSWVQLVIFVGICVGWVGSYIFRVGTKQMTYAKQLQDYEEAVMRKRLEELPEEELDRLVGESERQRQQRGGGGSPE